MEQFLTSEEKTLLSISFSQLKPACDQLITNPSKQHVNQLLKILNETPPEAIQKLTHYILLPIELHLRNEALKWEVKLYLLQCMKLVLQKSTLDDIKKIQNLYSLLFLLISKEEGLDRLYVTSEEFLLEVLECVTALMTSPGVAEFYQISMHPQLSFGVYKCVLIIKSVKASLVQSKAFNCLLALTQTHDECQCKPKKEELVNLMKKMLPGIVSCCSHAVSVGALQQHSVTIGAVRTWSKIICLVMKDEESSDQNISIETVRAVWEDKVVTKPADDWTSMANDKLKSSTDIIMTARNHPHWRARLEVSCASRDVLSTCRRTMPSSVNAMLETLIILSQDDMKEVSSPASQTLQHLFESDDYFQLENLLQENLFELLQRMSCIIDTNDETKQVSDFHLLKGYLLCMGKQRLTQLLMANVYLEQLFSSLTTIVELETSHVSLLDNDFKKDFVNADYQTTTTPWKLLRHFTDTKLMLSKVDDVCRVLAQCCDVRILVQYLLDMFETEVPNRKEICIVLSFVLKHAHVVDTEVKLRMVKSVMESILHGKVWHAPLSLHVRSEYTGHVADNIAQARSNIVLACLLCEILGAAAQCVAGPAFKQCLFQCLYVLMERAGSQHEYISQAGLQAIQNIVQVCQYTNTAHLISDNIDYLSYHITIQLRQETPLVLDAIKVILQQANDRVLPSIEDILDHVLRQGPSMFVDDNKKLSHLNMYLIFVTMIQQSYCNLNPVLGQTVTPVDYVQDLLDYEKLKNTSEDYEKEEDEDENIPQEEEPPHEEVEAPRAPKYISMVEAILNTCLHFLPNRNLSHQVLVLQIINKGIQILASYNEDVLLPLVHKVWSPLVNRLQDTAHPLILNHSFNLLLTLAITSKDFIRSRTIKEVIPSLSQFLKNSATESKLKDAGSAYRLTHQYKLQLNLLTHLHQLILCLGLREKDTYHLLSTVSVYLSMHQPAPLQKATVELFRQVIQCDMLRYIAWTQLMSLWPEQAIYEHPKKPRIFKTFNSPNGQPIYKKNVSLLYEHFHAINNS